VTFSGARPLATAPFIAGVALLMAAAAPTVLAQGPTLTVEPAAPTTADAVRLRVVSLLPNPPECFDITTSHEVTGSQIALAVNIKRRGLEPPATPLLCPAVVGTLDVNEEVGRLPAGTYAVDLTLNAPCCFPCDLVPCHVSLEFDVLTPAVLPKTGGAHGEGDSAALLALAGLGLACAGGFTVALGRKCTR
jgi:hypothetical protein